MLLNDFSGGRNSRVSPHLLLQTEAQIYKNIDNSSGSIKPIKGPTTVSGVTILPYFTYFYANSEWVSRTNESDFVEYREKLYISDGGELDEYDGTTTRTLGIQEPTEDITVSDTILGTNIITFSETTPGTLAINKYTLDYIVSFYSSVLDTTVYKSYTYIISDYNSAGIDISIDIAGLSSSYFANGDLITVYRQSTTYKKVASIVYNVAGVNIVDDTFNLYGNDDIPSNYYADNEGFYTYVYTYYDSTTDRESKPSLPSSLQNQGLGNILIGAIPKSTDLTETSIDKIRVYRLGGSLTQYTLLKELTYPAVATTPFIDVTTDINVAGNHILDSILNDIPLSGLKYITEAYAMLFAALDDKLYFSEIAKPYAWPATYFLDFEDTISGIGVLSVGLLVFTKYKTYIVTGSNPQGFSKYLLSSSQGCISHKSIQFVDNSLVWISEDGICTTIGGAITVLSLLKLGDFSFSEIYSTAILDNVYYISYNDTTDKIMAFDFRYNKIIRDIDVTGTRIVAKKDGLYQYYAGALQELLVGDNLQIHWKSPILTEGSYTNYKTYKDVHIRYNGTFTFKIYLDGTLINTISLTGDTTHTIKTLAVSKGYGIEFEAIGTGDIYEINYSVTGRRDGK